MDAQYTTLKRLAGALGIPEAWLRAEAEAGRIPSLDIGRRRLFDPEAVRAALAERSRQGVTCE